MPILNYTTGIESHKTIGEITSILAKRGVTTVSTRYVDGRAHGIAFTVDTPEGLRDFDLPANVDGVWAVFQKQVKGQHCNRAQAERTAWRILKDWIEAQMAIIESGLVTFDEVMLPWMLLDGRGKTVYESYRVEAAEKRLAIEAGK